MESFLLKPNEIKSTTEIYRNITILQYYNISDVTKYIQNSCVATLRRILDDAVHPLTIKLTRVQVRETRGVRAIRSTDRPNGNVQQQRGPAMR